MYRIPICTPWKSVSWQGRNVSRVVVLSCGSLASSSGCRGEAPFRPLSTVSLGNGGSDGEKHWKSRGGLNGSTDARGNGARPEFFGLKFGSKRSAPNEKKMILQGTWRVVEREVNERDASKNRTLMEREDGFRQWFPSFAVSNPDQDGFIFVESWVLEGGGGNKAPVVIPFYSEYLHSKRRVPLVFAGLPETLDLPQSVMSWALERMPTEVESALLDSPSGGGRMIDRLSVNQIVDLKECSRRFYFKHVLRLPDRVSVDQCRDFAVHEVVAICLSSDMFPLMTSAGPLACINVVSELVWKKMRKWFHSHLRRAGSFDLLEVRRVKLQAGYAVQQLLALASGRRVFATIPKPSEVPPLETFPVMAKRISVDRGSSFFDETLVAWFPKLSGSERPSSLVALHIGGHNDNPAVVGADIRYKLLLQAALLRQADPGVEVDQYVVLYPAPRRTEYLPVTIDQLRSATTEIASIAAEADKCASALPPTFRIDEQVAQKLDASSGDLMVMSETDCEKSFPAKDSDSSCSRCAFRPFCKPFVQHFEPEPLLTGRNKWLFGTVKSVNKEKHELSDLVSLEVEPLNQHFRDFVVEHKGAIGMQLGDLRPGDKISLVDANFHGSVAKDFVFADVADPFSVMVNDKAPTARSVERNASEMTHRVKQFIETRGLAKEGVLYDVEGLQYVEFD